MNGLAWYYATIADSHLRNGKQAIELAKKVCERTQWKNGGYVDTLAAAYAEDGQFAEAVRLQKKALEMSLPDLKKA